MPHPEDRRARERELEEIEVGLLLEGLYRRYGYDFRDYARGFARSRVRRRVREEALRSPSALLERVLRDRSCLDRLLADLSPPSSRMFDPPSFFRSFRRKVLPLLRTYPSVRIWQMGGAAGTEAFSLAILLEEEGLPGRFRIYATTPSGVVPEEAVSGAIPEAVARGDSDLYSRAEGRRALEEYGENRRGRTLFRGSLRRRVVFAPHCLATDGPFNEFQVVLCGDVQSAFNESLQARFHDLVHRSLARFGFLSLGRRGGLGLSPHRGCYAPVASREGLYRKVKE